MAHVFQVFGLIMSQTEFVNSHILLAMCMKANELMVRQMGMGNIGILMELPITVIGKMINSTDLELNNGQMVPDMKVII